MLVPLNFCLMWSLEVASFLGRYLATSFAVKIGRDVKAFCLMDWMKVLLDGLKQAARLKTMRSCLVLVS